MENESENNILLNELPDLLKRLSARLGIGACWAGIFSIGGGYIAHQHGGKEKVIVSFTSIDDMILWLRISTDEAEE